jgi:hypothetical protein
LPDRYEKAKKEIAKLEARMKLIRQIIMDPAFNADERLAAINLTTLGKYDDPRLDSERD